MNTSVITSLSLANSICLANLPAWIQLTSLASFLPPGLATLGALVDSTTHCETHTSRHFSIFSQILQTMVPLIHGCPLRSQNREQWKTLGTEWMKCRQALVWSSSSLRRWHPRSSVPLVLTRHSLPILNKQWTCVINLSMFFYYVSIVLLLLWGHKPCIGFFFGNSMCLMLLYVIQTL